MTEVSFHRLQAILIMNYHCGLWILIYVPITEVIAVPDPASLVTVHSYIPPLEPVIIVSSNTLLLEITGAIPCLLHSNMLLGPPSAVHVIVSVELKFVRTVKRSTITLLAGDTTERYEFINKYLTHNEIIQKLVSYVCKDDSIDTGSCTPAGACLCKV